MKYQVLLVQSDEGFAILCPSMRCASQGDTREEALEMIADAIRGLHDVYNQQKQAELTKEGEVFEIAEVSVDEVAVS